MGTTRPPEVKLFTVFVYLPQTAPTPPNLPTPPLLCPLSKNMPFTDTLHPAIKMPGGSTGEGVCSAFPSSLSSHRSQILPVSGERDHREEGNVENLEKALHTRAVADFRTEQPRSLFYLLKSLVHVVTPGLRDTHYTTHNTTRPHLLESVPALFTHR